MAILNTAELTSYITVGDEKIQITTNSNTHRANVLTTDIEIVKTASKPSGLPKSVITVSTQITNNTDLDLTKLHYADSLTNASFVEGTLKIGSELHEDLNPSGFDMPVTLGGSGADLTVSYDIMIDEVPQANVVTTQTTLQVQVDEASFDLNSNQLEINIIDNELLILKSADKIAVVKGDTLTYTISISNNGTLENTDLVLTDTLPAEVEFIEKSITIDNVAHEDMTPDNIEIASINPNQTINIVFKVTVL